MDKPPICDYEGSDYQESFWENGERAYEDAVEAIALQRLLPPSGKHLLELGAGAGRNTLRYKNFDCITLLDYSRSQLLQAKEKLGNSRKYRYVAASVHRLPFTAGIFDTATMIRTLHHLADAPAALEQVREVLCTGGVFILEFANKRNLKAILRYLLRLQDWSPFTREPVEFVKLNFNFHPAEVRKWLRSADFDIQRQLTVSHFRVGFLKRTLPLKWLTSMDALLQYSGNIVQLSPSIFVRASAHGKNTSGIKEFSFRCPSCGYSPLADTPPEVRCPQCGHVYKVRDGIYDFRLKDK
ncbi:MAG TPA: methyltransferase domain-containing protein [Anaerolineae bacterium]|nr:methyltransferase domain-containing protein [Anaerolineae bacterium]